MEVKSSLRKDSPVPIRGVDGIAIGDHMALPGDSGLAPSSWKIFENL